MKRTYLVPWVALRPDGSGQRNGRACFSAQIKYGCLTMLATTADSALSGAHKWLSEEYDAQWQTMAHEAVELSQDEAAATVFANMRVAAKED